MDIQAKEELYAVYCRNVDMVYRIAFLHLKNRSDAEDVVQNVFMKFLALKPEFANSDHEKSWFVLTARNHSRDMLKHWWNARRSADEPEICAEFEEKADGEITAALLKIPDKYRELIYLYYYEEYSVREIAAMIHRNESTVTTQLARGREKLRKILEAEGKQNERKNIISSI